MHLTVLLWRRLIGLRSKYHLDWLLLTYSVQSAVGNKFFEHVKNRAAANAGAGGDSAHGSGTVAQHVQIDGNLLG